MPLVEVMFIKKTFQDSLLGSMRCSCPVPSLLPSYYVSFTVNESIPKADECMN